MEESIVYDRIPKYYKRAILEEKDGYTDYLTGSKECYREYTNGGVYDEDAQLLVGLDYEGFALPKKHIFLGDYSPENYKGLIKNYIKGKNLNNMSNVIQIRTFIEALKKLEEDLSKFTDDTGFYVSYIDPSDIVWHADAMYDVNSDRMTLTYRKNMNPSLENMKELSNAIGSIYYKDEFANGGLEYLRTQSLVEGTIRPSWVMTEALNRLDKFADINSISDYKSGLKLIRK